MDNADRMINFGPGPTYLRTAAHVQVNQGHSSADFEVSADCDYVDLMEGSGEIEIDGIRHSLVSGHAITVPHGSKYQIHASASTDLAVMVYKIDRS